MEQSGMKMETLQIFTNYLTQLQELIPESKKGQART
jgi:hypothetical protein